MDGRARTIRLAQEELRRRTRDARRTLLALACGALIIWGAIALGWAVLG